MTAALAVMPGTIARPNSLAVKYPDDRCSAALMYCARGVEEGSDGKEHPRNPREVDKEMRTTTMQHLLNRGEFYRVGFGSFYLDRADNRLIPISKDSPELKHLLWCLGYLPKRGHTPAIRESVIDVAARAPMRPYHRIAYFGPDAIYLRASDNQMFRIGADGIKTVPFETDDVILIASDMAPLPRADHRRPVNLLS
jgi:hypothetical protein